MNVKKEIVIGSLVVVALAILFIGISFLKGTNVFSHKKIYYTYFKNLSGVGVATPIKISGYRVGSVSKVSFDYAKGEGALLELSLDPEVRVQKGSGVQISLNPLKGKELFLTPPDSITNEFLLEGDTIFPKENAGDIINVITNTIAPMMSDMMITLNTAAHRINDLANNKAIDSAMISLQMASKNISVLSSRIKDVSQPLSKVIGNIDKMSENMVDIATELNKIKVDSLIMSVNEASNAISHISQQLQSKNNTAGLLLNDSSIYYRLDSLVISADSLLNDLKNNPRKYINLSIF